MKRAAFSSDGPDRDALRTALADPAIFSALGGTRLRKYQLTPARAVLSAVLSDRGGRFAVLFPRQSGKNELQAQIEAYLLTLFSQEGGEIVKVSPTFRPQALNSVRRLERVLTKHPLTRGRWRRRGAAIIEIGRASITFLSGSAGANIVGATASLLLEVDEAQDVLPAKFDREIAPMAAARNAVVVFWGTAWTAETLLARELAGARAAETEEERRAFVLSAPEVAAEVPAYGAFVAGQLARLGRDHPIVRTQFFSETIDGQIGLFSERVIARIVGTHRYTGEPDPEARCVMLVDFAGSSETSNRGTDDEADARDRTAVTIVSASLSDDEESESIAPVWLVRWRVVWLNRALADQTAGLIEIGRRWQLGRIVADATGVGAGPVSALIDAFGPSLVRPFTFSSSSKSALGWDFSALLEQGRWREGALAGPGDEDQLAFRDTFLAQLRAARGEISPGPEKRLKWSVPDGAREAGSGARLHDDLLMSAAMITVVDREYHGGEPTGEYGHAPDPLDDYDNTQE